MRQRLEELRAEYRRGMEELARLERRRQELHRTLLRIGGAVQVLEELTSAEAGAADAGPGGGEPLRAVGG